MTSNGLDFRFLEFVIAELIRSDLMLHGERFDPLMQKRISFTWVDPIHMFFGGAIEGEI